MNKSALFELIRKEEVVLWAGAGMSIYAGYPAGKELGAILLKTLPTAYQDELDSSKPLPQFVEDYIRLQRGNMNLLIKTLNKYYQKSPKDLSAHKALAGIPHIKTIITTNYDSLFEQAYGDKIHKIVSGKNLMYMEKEKVSLFKVHGDLQDPDSILISAREYRAFFFENKDEIIWKFIETYLSTKTIVFVGYGLDDINVVSIYEKLQRSYKSHMNPAYLIMPSISKLKQLELEDKNIIHIPETGESFIRELEQNIKENIIHDVAMGYTTADTARKYIDFHGLKASFSNFETGFMMSNITKDDSKAHVNFQLAVEKDSRVQKKLEKWLLSNSVNSLVLSGSDLQNTKMTVEGLSLPLNLFGEKIKIRMAPNSTCSFDIKFDEKEILNIKRKTFYRGVNVINEFAVHTAKIIITSNTQAVNGEIRGGIEMKNNLDKIISSSTTEQASIYALILSLASGNTIFAYPHNAEAVNLGDVVEFEIPYSEGLAKKSSMYLEYFIQLKEIEDKFGVRFRNFRNLKEYANDVLMLHKMINGLEEVVSWGDKIDLLPISHYNKSAIESLNKVVEDDYEGDGVVIIENADYEFEIHGKKFTSPSNRIYNIIKPEILRNEKGEPTAIKSKENLIRVKYSCVKKEE